MVRFGAAVACLTVVVACGGQSVVDEGGGSGGGGTNSGGTGAAGGSVSGGTGGASTGGTGGMPMAGGTGGTMTGGTAGTAGAATICELPLVAGSCDALFYAYGFDPAVGHCVSFIYGGCEGNENRFETLAACEAACGGSTVGACPEARPNPGNACTLGGESCYYGYTDGCLCVPTGPRTCSNVDPNCPRVLRKLPPPDEGAPCIGDDCVSEFVVLSRWRCFCTAGTWGCVGEA